MIKRRKLNKYLIFLITLFTISCVKNSNIINCQSDSLRYQLIVEKIGVESDKTWILGNVKISSIYNDDKYFDLTKIKLNYNDIVFNKVYYPDILTYYSIKKVKIKKDRPLNIRLKWIVNDVVMDINVRNIKFVIDL